MRILVLGENGLAGQAFCRLFSRLDLCFFAVSRTSQNMPLTYNSVTELVEFLENFEVDFVINCLGLVDIEKCESDPYASWISNVVPAQALSEWTERTNGGFLHISTDHFYDYGENLAHSEVDDIVLKNTYAQHKFCAELLAKQAKRALILRTSITGNKGGDRKTLWEWVEDVVRNDKPASLYSDAYTSTIDVDTFAQKALLMLQKEIFGLYNLASSDVYTKEDFALELARQLGFGYTNYSSIKMNSKDNVRANCLGLDCSKAEAKLGEKLPKLERVISNLLSSETVNDISS